MSSGKKPSGMCTHPSITRRKNDPPPNPRGRSSRPEIQALPTTYQTWGERPSPEFGPARLMMMRSASGQTRLEVPPYPPQG